MSRASDERDELMRQARERRDYLYRVLNAAIAVEGFAVTIELSRVGSVDVGRGGQLGNFHDVAFAVKLYDADAPIAPLASFSLPLTAEDDDAVRALKKAVETLL